MKTIEELKAIAREVNARELREQINESWVDIKIDNHLKRNPHLEQTSEDIKKLIMTDDLVASFFAKDPSRQNFTEKVISEVISKISGIQNFKNLPSSTNWYLINGEIQNLTTRPIGVKNIDYVFDFDNQGYVATQKYTKGEGGAQDNQFNDVVNFLKHSIGLKGTTAMAIVDGAYYTEKRLADLRSINPKAVVVSGFELEEWLNEQQ